jgi:hypothetical protein
LIPVVKSGVSVGVFQLLPGAGNTRPGRNLPPHFHRNFTQCQVTVILTGFLSPVFAFRLLSGNVCPGLSSQVCYHPDSGLPVVLLPELLPSEVLADGAPFCPSYGLHCCFPPMVKRFRLSPLSVSGKFSVAEAPCYLSAVWLNLPKNTLQRLVFVGFRRCYPPGSGSGSSGKRVFTRAVWLASQLSFAFLSLTFRKQGSGRESHIEILVLKTNAKPVPASRHKAKMAHISVFSKPFGHQR